MREKVHTLMSITRRLHHSVTLLWKLLLKKKNSFETTPELFGNQEANVLSVVHALMVLEFFWKHFIPSAIKKVNFVSTNTEMFQNSMRLNPVETTTEKASATTRSMQSISQERCNSQILCKNDVYTSKCILYNFPNCNTTLPGLNPKGMWNCKQFVQLDVLDPPHWTTKTGSRAKSFRGLPKLILMHYPRQSCFLMRCTLRNHS